MVRLVNHVVASNVELVSSLDDSRRGNVANLVLGDIVSRVVGVAEVVLDAVAGPRRSYR